MKEQEILGLILVMYDYDPKPKEKKIYCDCKGLKLFPYATVVEPINYLKRKKYMDDKGLTKKAWKLLNKYHCHIKQLEKDQEEKIEKSDN